MQLNKVRSDPEFFMNYIKPIGNLPDTKIV